MLIKSIVLNNFRQFKGKQTLSFSCDPQKNVTVLLGDNTFGKTTILQAFNWCLYGKAIFPKDSNPDFLLNLEVALENAGIKQKCEVFVEIELEHKNLEYTIRRTEVYYDRTYNNWNPISSKVEVSYKEDGITKQVKEGTEKNIINSILPESLSGYFFFDTERVSDIGSKKDLPDAVKGLLGLAPVKNARDHLGKRTSKSTIIGKWYSQLDSLGDEKVNEAQKTINEKTSEKEELQEKISLAKCELDTLNQQKEKLAIKLRENQETANLQVQKELLEKAVEDDKNELEYCNKLYKDFFNDGIIDYLMLSLIPKVKKLLKESNVSDRGIRDMTATSIEDIIKSGHCICGAKIIKSDDGKSGNDVYMHILEELKYLPPESIGTSRKNYNELIETSEYASRQFYPTIEQKYGQIATIRRKIFENEDKIQEIGKSIAGKEDMKSCELEMDRIKGQIKSLNEKISDYNRNIGQCENEILSAQKTYDASVVSSETNEKLIKYIAYSEKVCDWIDNAYDKKETEIRTALESRVNQIFTQMYHGTRRVELDKQYHVSLFSNVNGKEIVTGESEGLKRVKNFAFIAGLVDIAKEKASMGSASDKISWNNEAYPLVMDAPFSNADQIHIRNISQILPEVANQVIMFVMKKDWQYAQPVIQHRVGKQCSLVQLSETNTEIEK